MNFQNDVRGQLESSSIRSRDCFLCYGLAWGSAGKLIQISWGSWASPSEEGNCHLSQLGKLQIKRKISPKNTSHSLNWPNRKLIWGEWP